MAEAYYNYADRVRDVWNSQSQIPPTNFQVNSITNYVLQNYTFDDENIMLAIHLNEWPPHPPQPPPPPPQPAPYICGIRRCDNLHLIMSHKGRI
jgi:hypothetical protein